MRHNNLKTRLCILPVILAGFTLAAHAAPPNPYCVTGGNWAPNGLMKRLGMPGGVDDLTGSLAYTWGTFTDHTRLALTNPSWRWTTFGRKPPFHSYDVEKDAIVDLDKTRDWIRKHPGWIYIIGNEPDNKDLKAGDGVTTEQYARMYYRYHTLIKEIDPTATLVIGAPYAASFKSEVEADAKWWTDVLAHYKRLFNEDMPIDVWNCHCYTPPGRLDPERIINEFFIPYREFVDTVAGGIYADKPLWCTEFGIAMWSGVATPEYMAEFIEQLCPRLEREYKLPSGKTRRVCDRFFWFLGPWAAEWSDSSLLAKDRKTPTIVGKTYSRLANGYPNPLPPPPETPPPAREPLASDFETSARPWKPMGGDWIVRDGAYVQTSVDKGWGTRSHLPFWYGDVRVECDVKINSAPADNHWAGVHLRHSTIWSGGIGGNLVYLRKNGELGLTAPGHKEPVARQIEAVKDTGSYHRLSIEVIGPRFTVSVDGEPILHWRDPEPGGSLAGLISLEAGKAEAQFDNVRITPLHSATAPAHKPE